MNIVSFILLIVAIVFFAGAGRGVRWGSIGLGLALATGAWLLHVLWVVDHINTVS